MAADALPTGGGATERVILALDVGAPDRALALAGALGDLCGGFKVGLELFAAAGPDVVRRLVGAGLRVFLDLKFHDIPHTVAGAARAAARLGCWMLDVHAAGGSEMMRRAGEEAAAEAARLGLARPLVVAVTVLTSLDRAALAAALGWSGEPADLVRRLALLAVEAGLDGVVCSPREAPLVKETCGRSFLTVTPGIRPSGAGADDQRRFAGPAAALAAGADYLVVGRTVTAAPDPRAALAGLVAELAVSGGSEAGGRGRGGCSAAPGSGGGEEAARP